MYTGVWTVRLQETSYPVGESVH